MNVIRLLLVDDHPVLRAGLRGLLTIEPDFQVAGEANDGLSAIQLSAELKPDVVLMDVTMPELGGPEATKQITAHDPNVAVLALSAHEEGAFARIMLDAGAAGYALKRSASDELVRAIRTVASGEQYIDPALAPQLTRSTQRRATPARVNAVSLSERESEVVRLTARGLTAKEMAQQLHISPRTLETYKARAMEKLCLKTRADLIRYAARRGWLQ